MKKQRYFYLFFVALCAVCFCASCSEEKMSEPAAAEATALDELKAQLNLQDLSLPILTTGEKDTRGVADLFYTPSGVTPDWSSYEIIKEGNNTIWMVDLRPTETLSGIIESYYYGKKEEQSSNAIFKLGIKQSKGKAEARILTFIPNEEYTRGEKVGYDLSSIEYDGTVIISSLEGEIIYGEKYEEGEIAYRFTQDGKTIYDAETNNKCEVEKTNNFYFAFNMLAQKFFGIKKAADGIANMVLMNVSKKATRKVPEEKDWWKYLPQRNSGILDADIPL